MTRERRRWPRVGWDGEALACVGMHRIRCRGRDLSATGLALEGEWVAYPGQHVSLLLSVDGHRIDAYGEVAWAAAAAGRYVWGVRFVALHDRCRRSIEEFVASRIEEIEARTPIPGVPALASQTATDPVVLGRPEHERQDTLDVPFRPTALGSQTDVSALDLEDLPTGVYRRVAREPEAGTPSAVPIVTGGTLRIPLTHDDDMAEAPHASPASSFAAYVPPLLDDSPLDRSRELDLHLDHPLDGGVAAVATVPTIAAPVQSPTPVRATMPSTLAIEVPSEPEVDPREEKRRRIEAILSASKRRRPDAQAPKGEPAKRKTAAAAGPARARSDRFSRVDSTPQMKALYEAALRDLERGA